MKTGWKIGSYDILKFRKFSRNMLLDQSIWICKWVRWWCHRLTIFHSFCSATEMTKISYISCENVRLALNSSLNRCRIMLTPIYLDMTHTRTYYHKFGQNIKIFTKFYVQYIWQVVRWCHHQLTHLHIHIDWSRNVLWKFAKLQSVITSLFFNRFSSGFHCYVWKVLLFLLSLTIKPVVEFLFKDSFGKKVTWLYSILSSVFCKRFLQVISLAWANLHVYSSGNRRS